MDCSDDIYRMLPASVKEIADVIGVPDTLKLLGVLPKSTKSNGGLRLTMYVPKRLEPRCVWHSLYVRQIGKQKTNDLIRAFGGETLHPAACLKIFKKIRNDGIKKMLALGANPEVIQKVVCIHPATVDSILKKEMGHELQ